MDTKFSVNCKFTRMSASILSIFMIVASAFPATSAFAQEDTPAPFFAVSLTQHWFMVNNFLPETLVTISVYDSKGSSIPVLELSRNTDEFGNLSIEGWEHTWDLEPDNYVIVTDGATTKTLLLEYVTLDVFDPVNDLVTGHAVPYRLVSIGVGNADGERWMDVTADENGAWSADFTAPGSEFDLTEDAWAGAHVADEDGDVTAAHNSGPPEPPAWFTVFPEQEVVEAWNWPLNSTIHMVVDDPNTAISPDYEQDGTITYSPWGSYQLWSWFEVTGAYDIKPGDMVTLSDGTTQRTHVVRQLSITGIDAKHNTVSGTSEPEENVSLWSWEDSQAGRLQVTANHSGAWTADFDDLGFDLVPGNHVRAEVWDEGGNDTAVDWYVYPRYTGHWRAIDSHDQSNMQMTISGGGNNQYQLIWTDDYWSICKGRNSIGLGIGSIHPGGFLRVDWVIRCQGAVIWSEQIDYEMDLETRELWDGINAWSLVGGQ